MRLIGLFIALCLTGCSAWAASYGLVIDRSGGGGGSGSGGTVSNSAALTLNQFVIGQGNGAVATTLNGGALTNVGMFRTNAADGSITNVNNNQTHPIAFFPNGAAFFGNNTLSISSIGGISGVGGTWDDTGLAVSSGSIFGSFNGDGSSITSLNASQLTSGTVPFARIAAPVLTNQEIAASTFQGAVTLSNQFLLTGVVSPSSLGADQNDYNPTGLASASRLRLSSSTTVNITGLAAQPDGTVIDIKNVGSNPIVLKSQSSSSTAANRFQFAGDITLNANQGTLIQYDGNTSNWRRMAGTINASSDISGGTVPAARGGAGTVNGVLAADGSGNVSLATAGQVNSLFPGFIFTNGLSVAGGLSNNLTIWGVVTSTNAATGGGTVTTNGTLQLFQSSTAGREIVLSNSFGAPVSGGQTLMVEDLSNTLRGIGAMSLALGGNYLGGSVTMYLKGQNSEIDLGSGIKLKWSSNSTGPDSGQDVGISRNAAGVLEVNSGTAGTFRDLILRKSYGVQTAAGTVTSTYSLDVTLGKSWKLTTTASTALTITPTAGGTADQEVTLIITSDATGGDVVTFASPFKPSGTMTLTASKVHTIRFISDGTNLYEVARTTGL